MRHSDRPSLLTKFFNLDAALAAKPWGRVAVIVLALALTVAMTYLLAGKREVIAADTRDYLAFSPLRVFGYPTFLTLVSSIADVRISAVVVQTLIFLGSSVFLSLVVLKATRSLVLTLALIVLLYGNIVTTIYNYIAVTESLVTSSAMVALGALIQFYRTRRVSWFALICVMAALNIVIRPAGQVYLPFLIVIGLYAWAALRVSPITDGGRPGADRAGQLRLDLRGELYRPRLHRHQQQSRHRPAGQGDAAGAETCRRVRRAPPCRNPSPRLPG